MKIFLGSDHGGYELKNRVRTFLEDAGYQTEDVGCDGTDSCDYPIFGKALGQAVVADSKSLGIAICGSGIGISIAANRIEGARAALCNSVELACLAREHNGANILAMGDERLL